MISQGDEILSEGKNLHVQIHEKQSILNNKVKHNGHEKENSPVGDILPHCECGSSGEALKSDETGSGRY